jgi:hypothetical protein
VGNGVFSECFQGRRHPFVRDLFERQDQADELLMVGVDCWMPQEHAVVPTEVRGGFEVDQGLVLKIISTLSILTLCSLCKGRSYWLTPVGSLLASSCNAFA